MKNNLFPQILNFVQSNSPDYNDLEKGALKGGLKNTLYLQGWSMGLTLTALLSVSSAFADWVVPECPPDPVGDYGARLVLTIRDCVGKLDSESCTENNGTAHGFYGECLDSTYNDSLDVPGLGMVAGNVAYTGPAALPTIREASYPSATSRNGSTQESWQKYTYNGTGPSILPIQGQLTFSYSELAGEGPGTAFFYVILAVVDASLVDVSDFIYDDWGAFIPECGQEATYGMPPGSIIAVDYFVTDGSPAVPVTLDVSKRCDDGSDVVVSPGDSFIVTTASQAIADRGGFADAWNTLRVKFSDETPPEVLKGLVDSIQPACEDCGPELLIVEASINTAKKGKCLKLNGNGKIPTTIYGSEFLDTSLIRIDESLTLSGMMVSMKGKVGQCHVKDADHDGFEDLKCQFEDDLNQWEEADSEATVRGKLNDGTPFEGVGSACVML